jgi:hypothetical protein
MGTQYVKPLDITVGRLTYGRVSDILDQLRKADWDATRKAIASLPTTIRRIIKARANLSQHPRRSDVARATGWSEARTRQLEIVGLKAIFAEFQQASKVKLEVRW